MRKLMPSSECPFKRVTAENNQRQRTPFKLKVSTFASSSSAREEAKRFELFEARTVSTVSTVLQLQLLCSTNDVPLNRAVQWVASDSRVNQIDVVHKTLLLKDDLAVRILNAKTFRFETFRIDEKLFGCPLGSQKRPKSLSTEKSPA